MTDYDETRRRRRTRSKVADTRPVAKYKFCVCERCGYQWTKEYYYSSELKAIEGPNGGYLCEKCRGGKGVRHIPSPPPKRLQVTIEERFGAKK